MGSDNEEQVETCFEVTGEISGELPDEISGKPPGEISFEEPKNHFVTMSID